MTCIIYAKSRSILPDIWQCIKKDRNNDSLIKHNMSSLLQKSLEQDGQKFVTRKGFGMFCKILKKVYVVTCSHIIGKVNMEVNTYANNKKQIFTKYPLELVKVIDELDIAILKFKNDSCENDVDYNIRSNSIGKISEAIQRKTEIKLVYSVVKGLNNSVVTSEINVNKFEVHNDYLKSIIIPKIPIYKFVIGIGQIPNQRDNDIEGLSGTMLVIDDKPVGMTMSYNNSKLEAIPIEILYEFVTRFLKNQTAKMSSFYFCSNVVEMINSDDKIDVCHRIVDDKDITYANTNTKKDFRFKENDIIYSINNNKFTVNGTIIKQELDYELPLDTYLMLYCYGTSVTFQIYRITGNTYKTIVCNLEGQPFGNVYSINISASNNYLYWEGLIFTELSEELIINMNTSGIQLVGKYFEKNKIINSNMSKIIVLVDIDYRLVNNELTNTFKQLGLPYVKYKNGYTLFILEKIGQKKITSLNDLELVISSKSEKVSKFTCTYTNGDNDKEFKIIV